LGRRSIVTSVTKSASYRIRSVYPFFLSALWLLASSAYVLAGFLNPVRGTYVDTNYIGFVHALANLVTIANSILSLTPLLPLVFFMLSFCLWAMGAAALYRELSNVAPNKTYQLLIFTSAVSADSITAPIAAGLLGEAAQLLRQLSHA
jgi:hypothetical protein